MMSMAIQFDSFGKIKSWFKNLTLAMNSAARDTGRVLTHEAKKLAIERVRSPKRKPGKGAGSYFQSIHSEFKDDTVTFVGNLKSDSPIAGIIEFGSRPHTIRSDNKLLFWPGANHPVKEVNHPGTPAFRVLGDAVEDASLQTRDRFGKALKNQFES